MKRRLLCLALAVCLLYLCVCSTSAAAVQAEKNAKLTDIDTVTGKDGKTRKTTPEEREAAEYAAKHILTDEIRDGLFLPNRTEKMKEVYWWLWTLAGKPAATGKNPFVGIVQKEDEKYLSSLHWASQKGLLLNGVKKNAKGETVGLDDVFTRKQVLIVLFRMWMLSKNHQKNRESAKKDSELLKGIADAKAGEKSFQEYADALLWALKKGIVKRDELKTENNSLYFTPDAPVIRLDFALWTYRYQKLLEAEKKAAA